MNFKKSILYVWLCILPQLSYAQWTEHGQVPDNVTESLSFKNGALGFAVGKGGIYRTVDGGADWQYYSDTSGVYNRTHFKAVVSCDFTLSCDLSFAAGEDTVNHVGVLFQTDDGGASWKYIQAGSTTSSSWNALAIYREALFVGGNDGAITIYEFSASSPYWVDIATKPTGDIHAIAFTPGNDSDKGLVATTDGIFWSWSNSGTSWDKVQDGNFEDVAANAFQRHYAIDENYVSSALPSQPQVWAFFAAAPVSQNFTCMEQKSVNPHRLSVGSTNGILSLNASNGTLEYQPSADGYSVNAIYFVSQNRGFALCSDGVVLKTLDGGGPSLPYATYNSPPNACVGSLTSFENLGYSGYNYSWYVDGNLVSTDYDLSFLFSQPGTYEVLLQVDNGLLSNTFKKDILAVNPPDSLINYSTDPALICKEGQITITLTGTEPGIDYQLLSQDAQVLAFAASAGGTLAFDSPVFSDTAVLVLRAANLQSNCYSVIADSVIANVEEVESFPHAGYINVPVGENVLLHPRNINGVEFQWHFEDSQLDVNTAEEIPIEVQFQDTGLKEVTLVISSSSGCSDTASTKVHVYDPQLFDEDCFVTGFSHPVGQSNFQTFGTKKVLLSENGSKVYVSGNYLRSNFEDKVTDDFFPINSSGSFVARYDTSGVINWMVTLAENGPIGVDFPVAAYDMALHSDGGLVVTGSALNALFTGNDGRTIKMESDSLVPDQWGFLMKLDENGALQWQVRFSRASGLKVVTDAYGDIYVLGRSLLPSRWLSRSGSVVNAGNQLRMNTAAF